jgi:hypothetical protein
MKYHQPLLANHEADGWLRRVPGRRALLDCAQCAPDLIEENDSSSALIRETLAKGFEAGCPVVDRTGGFEKKVGSFDGSRGPFRILQSADHLGY